MSDRAYVITAEYTDKSSFKVLCALESCGEAVRFSEWLRTINPSMGEIKMHEVPTALTGLKAQSAE